MKHNKIDDIVFINAYIIADILLVHDTICDIWAYM